MRNKKPARTPAKKMRQVCTLVKPKYNTLWNTLHEFSKKCLPPYCWA